MFKGKKKPGFILKSMGNRGLTLLEVLAAIAILAFGLLAIATMQATSVKGNSQALGITEAMNLAQDKAEYFMRLSYNDPDLDDDDADGTAGLDDTVNTGNECGSAPVSDGFWPNSPWECNVRYRVFWNVAVDEPIDNVKTIRIIVEWDDRGTRKRAVADFMKSNII